MTRSVINFIKLDWLSFKPYRKLFVLATLVSIIGVFDSSNVMGSGFLATFTMSVFTVYFFASQGKNGMERLYVSLPIVRLEMIIGRYLSAILAGICSILFTMSSVMIIMIFKPSISYEKTILCFIISITTFLIYNAIQFPIYFKIGHTKGMSLAALPIILAAIVIFGVRYFLNIDLLQTMDLISVRTLLILVPIAILSNILSIFITKKTWNIASN